MRFRSILALFLCLALLCGACGDDAAETADPPATTAGAGTTQAPATTAAATTTTAAVTTTTEPPPEDPAYLWIADWNGQIGKIDLATMSCDVAPVGLSADNVLLAFGSLWVSDCLGGQLVRFDPVTLEETGRLDLGACPWVVAADGESIWVALGDLELARAIDPATGATIEDWEIPGMTSFAAWNPTIAANPQAIINRMRDIISVSDILGRTGREAKLAKLAKYGGSKIVALVKEMTQHTDPRRAYMSTIAVVDTANGELGRRIETYGGHVVPIVSNHRLYGLDWDGFLRILPNGDDTPEQVFTVDGINLILPGNQLGVTTWDGRLFRFPPNQLGPGMPVQQFVDGGAPPNLADDPSVTTIDLNVCEDFDFGNAAWLGEMGLQQLIAGFTPNGFVDHPMAAAPLPGLGVGTSRITDCGMDTSAGSFDFYTVLNDPQPGEMLDFYARQDDVPVLVETMEVDESGRAVFPLPNFAGIGIDESAEYDLFAVPAGEAPDEPNCRVTFNIEE